MTKDRDLLIGAKVIVYKGRTPGVQEEAVIQSFKWMPAEPGYNPHLVVVVKFDDGTVDWRFLQYVKVING